MTTSITNSQIREGLRERELAASKLTELGYVYGPSDINPHIKAWELKNKRPLWQQALLDRMEADFRINVLEPALLAESAKVVEKVALKEVPKNRVGHTVSLPTHSIQLLPIGHYLKNMRFTGRTFVVHTVETVRPLSHDAKRLGFSGVLVGFTVGNMFEKDKECWLPIDMVQFT